MTPSAGEPTVAAPITPAELNGRGLDWFGVGVVGVELRLADGRVQRLELPRPGPDDEPDSLTEMQRDVLEVVTGMAAGAVTSNDELARLAGWSNSDALRVFVRLLAATGKLKKTHRGWQRV